MENKKVGICYKCDAEANLRLNVIDSVKHRFRILENGSLMHLESDGEGQEFEIYCPVCGCKYDFEFEQFLTLQDKFVLMVPSGESISQYTDAPLAHLTVIPKGGDTK